MMRRIIGMIVLVLIVVAPSGSVEISGYYENSYLAEYFGDNHGRQLDGSKFRIDFSSGGADNELELNANVNFIAYHNAVTWDMSFYFPDDINAELRRYEFTPLIGFPSQRFSLDNAYLTWRKGNAKLTAGRQQLSWGSGYSFNPTDLFHKKDLIDPEYEKAGVDAFRLDYSWGIGGQMTFVLVPDIDADLNGYAMRIGNHFSSIGYDVALTGHYVTDENSYYISESSGRIWVLDQIRRAVGLEFSGALLGLGVWFEGNYNTMEKERDFFRGIAGCDYTLTNGLYLMFEGLYDERAEAVSPYPVGDWLSAVYTGEPVGRYRFMGGIRKGIGNLYGVGAYLFGGTDGSFMLNPRVDVDIAQNADLTLFGAISFGDDDGQFVPGMYALTVRARVYF